MRLELGRLWRTCLRQGVTHRRFFTRFSRLFLLLSSMLGLMHAGGLVPLLISPRCFCSNRWLYPVGIIPVALEKFTAAPCPRTLLYLLLHFDTTCIGSIIFFCFSGIEEQCIFSSLKSASKARVIDILLTLRVTLILAEQRHFSLGRWGLWVSVGKLKARVLRNAINATNEKDWNT